jgi:hypothetical protein
VDSKPFFQASVTKVAEVTVRMSVAETNCLSDVLYFAASEEWFIKRNPVWSWHSGTDLS